MLKSLALTLSIFSLSACTMSSTTSSTMPEHELLIGSYTQGTSQGIYRYRYNSQSGQINTQPEQVIPAANPSFLVVSADQTRLFSVNENGPGQADNIGQASSFLIKPLNQHVSEVSRVNSAGDEPTHACLSPDEQYLFVANYAVSANPGGSLSVLPINSDATLGSVTQRLSHPASGANPERQISSHVHSVVVSPDQQYVFAADLGADRVFAYRYTPKQPAHQPLTAAGSVELPKGSGPRHLLFSKDGKHAYLTLELSNQLAYFDYQQGQLTLRKIFDLNALGTSTGNYAAGALHTSADSKFLYVASRGPVSHILVFKLDPESAEPELLQRYQAPGEELREFTEDPSGNYLLIANQRSNEVVVIARDSANGTLGKVQQRLPVGNPSDLLFLRNQ